MQIIYMDGQCFKNYQLTVLNGISLSKFNEKSINNYDENCDIGNILEADVEYPKRLHNLCNDLPFLPERMKTKKYCCKLEVSCNCCFRYLTTVSLGQV